MNEGFNLFLLMQTLSALKSKEKIIDLFVESLNEVFAPARFRYAEDSESISENAIPVKTNQYTFGYLISNGAETIDRESGSLIVNAAQMTGIILERLELAEKLKNERDSFERLAGDRLIELEKTIEELRAANDSAIRLIEELKDEFAKRVKSEAELKESEEKFRHLFETMSTGVIYQSRDGVIISANPASERTLGITIEQMQGKTSMDPRWRMIDENGETITGENHPAMIALRTGNTIGPVIRGVFIPEKNEYVWLKISAIPMFKLGEENPNQVYASFDDITDIKRAEEALRQTEQLLQLANRATNDVIWDWDIVTDTQRWNEAGTKVFGWTEIVERPVSADWWVQRVHPDDRQRIHDTFFAVVENPLSDSWLDEYRFLKTDGTYADVLDRGYVLRDEHGKAVRMVGAMLDITERKRAEEALRESEERFTLAMKASNDGLFDWNLETNSIYYSPRWKKMLGYEDDELPNDFSVWETTTKPEDVKKSWELQKKLISKQIDRFVIEFKMKHKLGHWIDILSRADAIFDENGKAIRMVGTHTDITERKRAEEALRTFLKKEKYLKEELALLLQRISDGFVAFDRDMNYVYVNNAGGKLLGRNPEELIGKNYWEEYPEAKGTPFANAYLEALKTQQTIYIEERYAPWDKWFANTIYPSDDGITIIFHDITELKRAEEALREVSARLSLAVKAGGVGIWDWDCVADTLVWDEQMYALYGISKNSFTGAYESWRSVVHPDDVKRGENEIARAISGEKNFDTEFRVIWPDGSVHDIRALATVIRDAGGKPLRIIGTNWDITESKRAEEALRESEAKFRMLFENMTAGFALHEMIYDNNGEPADYRFLELNPAFEKLTGGKAENFIGKTVLELFPNIERYWIETYGKVAKTGEPISYQNYSKEIGKSFDVYAFSPQRDQFAVVFVDITDRRNAELKLHEKNKELERQYEEYMQLNEVLRQTNFDLETAKQKAEESDKLKTAFLQNLSHEIRTPLNGILGFAKLLNDEDITKDEIVDFTSVINNSGQRLLEIVNNVLDISKIETGQVEIKDKKVSINKLLSDLQRFFEIMAKAKDLHLRMFNELDDENSYVLSDEFKLNQILTNLLSNAIKFTKNGGVDYGYRVKSGMVEFFVKDTGSGIPKEQQGRIFERFAQADISITRGYEGAGLGLAICKGLVELFGGKIWLESEVGRGTTFYFTIPCKKIDKQENINKTVNAMTEINKKHKILIAEDDNDSYALLVRILKNKDYDLLWAKNGQQAVDIFNDNKDIDLILMDIRMPVMDGIEATKLIKEIAPNIPVIAQTAYAFSEEKDRILSLGFDDYISKPIEIDLFTRLLEKNSRKNP